VLTQLLKVTGLHRFKNFEELYKKLPLEKCGYLPEQLSMASHTDMEKYYSAQMQEKYGVLAVEIVKCG